MLLRRDLSPGWDYIRETGYRPRAARPSIYRAKDANEKVNDLLLCVKSFFLATLYPGKIYLDNADPHRHLTSTLSLAFDCFRVGEQCMGGRSLRAAFLQLEPIITEGSIVSVGTVWIILTKLIQRGLDWIIDPVLGQFSQMSSAYLEQGHPFLRMSSLLKAIRGFQIASLKFALDSSFRGCVDESVDARGQSDPGTVQLRVLYAEYMAQSALNVDASRAAAEPRQLDHRHLAIYTLRTAIFSHDWNSDDEELERLCLNLISELDQHARDAGDLHRRWSDYYQNAALRLANIQMCRGNLKDVEAWLQRARSNGGRKCEYLRGMLELTAHYSRHAYASGAGEVSAQLRRQLQMEFEETMDEIEKKHLTPPDRSSFMPPEIAGSS
ncbi:hypothetical protein ACEPPN_015208 [Leptodophora sp. 'Broadleaf-Isolate-01']